VPSAPAAAASPRPAAAHPPGRKWSCQAPPSRTAASRSRRKYRTAPGRPRTPPAANAPAPPTRTSPASAATPRSPPAPRRARPAHPASTTRTPQPLIRRPDRRPPAVSHRHSAFPSHRRDLQPDRGPARRHGPSRCTVAGPATTTMGTATTQRDLFRCAARTASSSRTASAPPSTSPPHLSQEPRPDTARAANVAAGARSISSALITIFRARYRTRLSARRRSTYRRQ
jgi:hypothetical protein